MPHTFFIAPTEIKTGLTSITLGLIRTLDQLGLKVATCKPIANFEGNHRHRSIAMIHHASGIEPPQPITLTHAQAMVGSGKIDRLMEDVVAMHHTVAAQADVVIMEGIDPDRNQPYTAKLNVEMAKTLNAQVILVAAPQGRTPKQLEEHIHMTQGLYDTGKNSNLLGVIINKVNAPNNRAVPIKDQAIVSGNGTSTQLAMNELSKLDSPHFKILGLIPWDANLVAPRIEDIARYLQASCLNDHKPQGPRVARISLCARTVPNMVSTLTPGTLIVTPGDREDILLASAMAASNGVPLAGLLLTGGLLPNARVMELLAPSLQKLPVLTVDTDTFQTASQLSHMDDAVMPDDLERVESIMNHVADHLDGQFMLESLKTHLPTRLSPAAFRYQLVEMAKAAKKSVVLPEGEEPRTIQAAVICQQRGIAQCVLLGKKARIQQLASSLGIQLPDDLQILDPDEIRPDYIEPMMVLRKHKNLSYPMAEAQLEDSVVLGTMMLALDHVDGLVSGAIHTTANTIRPALQLIKTAPGAKLVSSVFFMLLPDQVMVYGDCAVNPDPNAQELADIALQSANSAQVFGIEPKVAMISYSTGASGSGEDVEKVRQATQIAQQNQPQLLIDGPLQYDAATTASVAASKAPDSLVAGLASVVIFPDLNTGNTTYKAVQRSANVVSIGPMLQGLAKPVNDLSRGALVEDIVYTIALTAIQAR
ncbi:phosphate acetyltransferase [Bermanella sp. 47_1433_sub80_T6]|nr:phosphate acetyltransferase [Bermanella sp. 47_1433_sub80_T6]